MWTWIKLLILVQTVTNLLLVKADVIGEDKCLEKSLMKKVCEKPEPFNISKCQPDINFSNFCSEESKPHTESSKPFFPKCPGYIGIFYVDTPSSLTKVTWPEVVAISADGNQLPVQRILGQANGTEFSVGQHEIHYRATNTFGGEDCLVMFKVTSSCSQLSSPDNGQFACTSEYGEGSVCKLKCFNDFRPNMMLPVSCQFQETMHWSQPVTNVKCYDVCRPIITKCPTKIIAILNSNLSMMSVTWDPATATDNDGIALINCSTGHQSSGKFPLGTSKVQYEVSDNSGNKEHCLFDVIVEQWACQEIVQKNICNLFITSCFDVYRGQICLPKCENGEVAKIDCPSQNLASDNWDVGKTKSISCSGYLVKMKSRSSSILIPSRSEPHTAVVLSFSFRVTKFHGKNILVIRREKPYTINKVLIISLSQDDLQYGKYTLSFTFQNKTLHIEENAVNEWNNIRIRIRVSGDSWTFNINQTVGNTNRFRSYEMQGMSLFKDNYYAVFGRFYSIEFPSNQEGLEICGFRIIDEISGNILNSLWPEGEGHFTDVQFATPTYVQLLINDGDSICRTSRNCSASGCKCSSGFSGEQCEIPPSVCVPGLCKNQGQCNDIGNNSFSCDCRKGFEGLYCEKETKKVCPEFQHQEDTVITCNKDYTNEICEVRCKSGRVRVDKFRQHSTYMCGASTSHKWVVLTNQHPFTDDEAPVCAETDWNMPNSLKADITVKFENIKCDQIQNTPCEDWCNINISVKNCQNQNNTVFRSYSLELDLERGVDEDGKLHIKDFYQKSKVSSALLHLVRGFYAMESKLLELRKVVAIALDQDRRKKRSNSRNHNLVEVSGIIVLLTAETICEEGSFNYFGSCAYCPSGTYQIGDTCQMCGPGYYQKFVGQTNCTFCPQGHISPVGSNTIRKCYVPDAKSKEEEEGLSAEAIAGIVSAVIAFLALVVSVLEFLRRRNNQ